MSNYEEVTPAAAMQWIFLFVAASLLALAGAVCLYYGIRAGSTAVGVSGAVTLGVAFKTFYRLSK